MKKRGIITLCVIVVIAAVVVGLMCFNPFCSRRKVAPITDMMVLYINGGQLFEKAALERFITPENRRLIAASQLTNVENREVADYFALVASNLDETGLSLSKPAYVYINGDLNENSDAVLVVEVHDAQKVDKLINMLSKFNEELEEEAIEVLTIGNKRTFKYENYFVGYDDSRIVVALSESGDGEALAAAALERPFSDLSVFGARDMGLYVDVDQIITLYETRLNNMLVEYEYGASECEYDYEIEWYEDNIASVKKSLARLGEVRLKLGEEASSVAGLTFESGRVVADVELMANEFSSDMFYPLNNNHLQSVSQEAIAVLNVGLNGKMVADIAKEYITSDVATAFNMNRNEFSFITQLACDALSSVNGDFTVALESIEGVYKRYRGVRISSVDVLAAADVKDRYIIDNVSQFGAGFLKKDGDDKYSANLSKDLALYVGQDEGVCYAGLNTTYEALENSALNATWAADVNNSLMYLLVDVENVMNSSYVQFYYNELINRTEPECSALTNALIEDSDYLYLNVKNFSSMEIAWVLNNKESNALAQIVEQVLPVVMEL